MDTLNVLAMMYKQELADANEKKILYQVQIEADKQQINELENKIKNLENEIILKDKKIKELEESISIMKEKRE